MARRFDVRDVIRMPHYPTAGGFRVWEVVGVHLGATSQEGTYELVPVDVSPNETIHVPCLMLETHPAIELVSRAEPSAEQTVGPVAQKLMEAFSHPGYELSAEQAQAIEDAIRALK